MTPYRIAAAALATCLGLTMGTPSEARPAHFGHFPWRSGPGLDRPALLGLGPVAEMPAYGTYAWPVVGPVIRGFEEPSGPYGSGHRGIDIVAPPGTPMRAAQGGVVAFAGSVGGYLFISIDHPDGVRTTYSWVSAIAVGKGQRVNRGEVIGLTGHGHPDEDLAHLHFGARVDTTYIDPMLLLERGDVSGIIHLAPLEAGNTRRA
jgi:murein DD-endopeptidase MepM/ murein hydrolase activator NlpD